MTMKEYKDFLIDGILEFQKHGQFTKEKLQKKNIQTLERIYDNIDTREED